MALLAKKFYKSCKKNGWPCGQQQQQPQPPAYDQIELGELPPYQGHGTPSAASFPSASLAPSVPPVQNPTNPTNPFSTDRRGNPKPGRHLPDPGTQVGGPPMRPRVPAPPPMRPAPPPMRPAPPIPIPGAQDQPVSVRTRVLDFEQQTPRVTIVTDNQDGKGTNPFFAAVAPPWQHNTIKELFCKHISILKGFWQFLWEFKRNQDFRL